MHYSALAVLDSQKLAALVLASQKLVILVFRLPLSGAVICQRRRFVAYHEQGRGCLYWVCEADFVSESRLCKVQTAARLNTLRGLATQQRLFYVYGAKSAATPNIKYKQPRSPCTPRGDGFRLPTLAPAFRQPETLAL